MKANESISDRVRELQAEGAERALVSIESLADELEEARRLAMADEKGASAAVAAVMGNLADAFVMAFAPRTSHTLTLAHIG